MKESDFIFVACPLSKQTRNLFDKAAFQKMKSTSVFINVARGGVKISDISFYQLHYFSILSYKGIVVQTDLIEALEKGIIFAAGLDVMDPEPLPLDHPLTKLSNCGKHLGSSVAIMFT